MMPSANTVSCSSAPPEKTLMRANRLLFSPVEAAWTASWTLPTLMPGAGIVEPSRNRTMTNRTKRIFFRRSGVRKAWTKALSTVILLVHMACVGRTDKSGLSPAV
jgi:hypothetical protein